jgi:hypothetical protein
MNLFIHLKSSVMKKIICIALLTFGMLRASAQNIVAAEYFFDVDPGAGLGTPISISTPGTTVNFTTSISTSSLSSGFHILAVRTKDASNIWSLFETRAIYISSTTNNASAIVSAEYFIDSDPGLGAGTPISIGASGNTVNFTAVIPTMSSSTGFHILAIRTRNADGHWSLFETRAFYISGSSIDAPSITAAEYFIDTDPGPGNATAVSIGTSGTTVNFIASVPTTSLAAGFHTLAIRTRNANGVWSLFETRPFYISNQAVDMTAITAAEYFIDTDPGVGNGSALTITNPGNTVNQTFLALVPPGTSNGQHLLAIRTRDVNGNWSLFEVREFTVSGSLPLDWISFTGQRVNNKIALRWITENEVNTAHFELERSRNGIDFSQIGQVLALGQTRNEYTFDDLQPLPGHNFYRLKQFDRNGTFEYSSIVRVYVGDGKNSLRLYPNPANSTLSIEFNGREPKLSIQIFDAGGKMVYHMRVNNQNVVTLPVATLARGSYWIVVSDGITQQKAQFIKE